MGGEATARHSLAFVLHGRMDGWEGGMAFGLAWIGLDQISALPFDELITAVFCVLLMSFSTCFCIYSFFILVCWWRWRGGEVSGGYGDDGWWR